MRWKAKRQWQDGDKRIRTKFLLFPKKIGDEVRWLETASWIETYHDSYMNHEDMDFMKWCVDSWITQEPCVLRENRGNGGGT